MTLDLIKLNSLENHEVKANLLQEWMDEEHGLDEILKFLLDQIFIVNASSGWTAYCINLLTVGIQKKYFQDSPLNSAEFLEILGKTSYFSQRRHLWQFQRSRITFPDPIMEDYFNIMKLDVNGPEKIFLKKLYDELTEDSNLHNTPANQQEIDSFEKYLLLERDKKLAWLLKVSSGKINLPDFVTSILKLEEDPYVLTNLARYFPELIKAELSLSQDKILELFRPFASIPNPKVRESLLDGLSAIFLSGTHNPDFMELMVDLITDSDPQVKIKVLKIIKHFPKSDLIPLLSSAIQDCKFHEELKAFFWILDELGLRNDLTSDINDVTAKLDRCRGLMATQGPEELFNQSDDKPNPMEESSTAQGKELENNDNEESSSQWDFDWKKAENQNLAPVVQNSSRWKIIGFTSLLALVGGYTAVEFLAVKNTKPAETKAIEVAWDIQVQKTLEREQLYLDGIRFLNKNEFKNALSSLTSAAELNHLDSLLKIAWMYEEGIGTEISYPQCKYWLLRAVELGSKDAEVQLGEVYLKEEETQAENSTKAFQIFKKFAEMGHPRAQNNLAMMLLAGKGVARDPSLARKWLELAANGGYHPAALNLQELDKASKTY